MSSPHAAAAKALPTKASPFKKAAASPAGIPEKQRKAALKILDERKAEDVVDVDVRGRSALADYVIIATGRSNRQLAAMAAYLEEGFRKTGARKIRVEGLPQGDWVLLDTGDVLVHLFRPEVRRYYNIEDLWSNPRRP